MATGSNPKADKRLFGQKLIVLDDDSREHTDFPALCVIAVLLNAVLALAWVALARNQIQSRTD